MTPLSHADVLGAWARGRELLLKGGEGGPGWPRPPARERPRAPRQKWPSEPATGERKASPVYKIQPITLGDLIDMKARSSYEKPQQRSARPKANGPRESVPVDAFAKPRTRVERAKPSMYGTYPKMPTS